MSSPPSSPPSPGPIQPPRSPLSLSISPLPSSVRPSSSPPRSPESPISVAEEPVTECKTHKRFYFEDPMITFEVEDVVFKVHRHFLIRESEVFETMFRLPAGQNKGRVEKPTKLPDVTIAELEALLTFFYDGMHTLPQDWKFWSDLLSISTRFCFDKIRQRAIIQLSSTLTPIEKIYHGKKYDVPNWLRDGYQSVCKRAQPLELPEAEKIGWETAIMLAKARELYYRTDAPMKFVVGPLFPPAPGSNLFEAKARSLEDEKAARAIDTVFGPARSGVEGSSPVSQEVGIAQDQP